MGNVVRKFDFASCGHFTTGSINVFVNGRGVSRVFIDTAIGIILGPGEFTVLVNGFPISLRGDIVKKHDESPHDKPIIIGGSYNVFAG